ncbi:hypothetical protein L3X38_023608 [Prunus dulcis]|uniref:Uncharacterized protein n=1 Tax=Prunus dulcis TaxID=3755 RepID=A0AAD4W052_PRUDU|nr:hypothetical protein L3X38_023608 [Prunus dulcis]
MTEASSSSSPNQLPPPAAVISPENGEEAASVVRSSLPSISLLRPPFPSSQMMVRPRGELRRQQFDISGTSHGSSKRGSYSSGSSSGRNYKGYRPGFSSSGGSNQSSSSRNRSWVSAARGTGRQLLSGSDRRSRPQCARETTAASTPGTGMQGRLEEIPQSVEALSSGGAQTSVVVSRGSSQPRGCGGRSRATGRMYNMSQHEAYASPDIITDLIPFGMVDLDVILGLDWLARHRASVDFPGKGAQDT